METAEEANPTDPLAESIDVNSMEEQEQIELESAEPLPAPVDFNETEKQEEIVLKETDPLAAPVDLNQMENENLSDIPLSDSSPVLDKNNKGLLETINISSVESSPAPVQTNKENLKPIAQNEDQSAVIRSLKKTLNNLKAKNARDLSVIKQLTRRDVVEKMSANHKLALFKERKSNLKLLSETRELYEKRLCDVEKFYVEKIALLEQNRTVAFDALLETKTTLDNQIKFTNEHLNNIINLIASYPSNTAAPVIQPLPIDNINQKEESSNEEKSIDEEPENPPKLVIENKELLEKIGLLETEVYEQKLRITCLENKIKEEITSKGQIQQKLAYTEILYRTTVKEKDDIVKALQDDLTNAKNSKNEMEMRHKEQFTKYDRMLKRSQAEIAVHQREVLALRTQFVPGTPTNFNPKKRKGTPNTTMIEQSTPSNSKTFSIDSNTPSTRSVATASYTPTAIISLSQNSSKTTISLRSDKAASESSTSSNVRANISSDDSYEPCSKPKNARVLRTRRKRAVKIKNLQ